MTFDVDLIAKAAELIDLCRERNVLIATAESCTGGLIAGLITCVAGSSDVFDAGFVTYSNEAKTKMIGVPAALIASHGAVSAEVARAMAAGAVANSRADLAVAVTGVAGPGGGTSLKPVGLVHLATASRSGEITHEELRLGDIGRDAIRIATIGHAIGMLQRRAAAVP
jgi:nicotinamide-nucleotide amidase